MWGTHIKFPAALDGDRFIPTHVGNTRSMIHTALNLPVHPHACGEHGIPRLSGCECGGSSPRMWGTPDRCRRLRQLARFIPTHVGNTHHPPVLRFFFTVHPHACGEHFRGDLIYSDSIGSSPRMWGTRARAERGRCCDRFIPTHVGNTDQ